MAPAVTAGAAAPEKDEVAAEPEADAPEAATEALDETELTAEAAELTLELAALVALARADDNREPADPVTEARPDVPVER